MNTSNAYKALADFQNAIQHMEEAKRVYAAVYGAAASIYSLPPSWLP